MAVNYTVQADVVDLTKDTPKPTDAFFVDSNVWFWVTYPNAPSTGPTQLTEYPEYLNTVLSNGAKTYHSGLSLAELAHTIEKTEREIYCQFVSAIRAKEYRHNEPLERTRIVNTIAGAWGQVTSLAAPLSANIDDSTTSAALNRLQSENVDGYDLFILESMKSHGVVQVITDDGDFSTVPGIQVFTANRNVIQAANVQGKLVTR
jgi:predicted nucleic acid-binding protein